jgi:AcrR family transcriptional regulator
MSDNERSPLPTGLAKQRRNDKQRRKPDLGIRRTRSLLSNALVAFMQEKSIDKITVQEVLDRATVGRSTFYLHFCDKDDLILCVLEEGLEMWSATLLRKQEKSYRIAPVAEFVMHVGDAKKLYRALVDSGRIHAFFELAQGYFARSIARHLKDVA